MEKELIKIIDELKNVFEQTGLILRDNEIMDFAVRIYNSREITNSKNKSFYAPKRLGDKEELATEKQIYALKKAGKEVTKGLTKKEAFKLIKELKEI